MTASTFLIHHGGWHLARPGAIVDFREESEDYGAIRLAWFDVASEGFVCWDGEPTVCRELTEDGSIVAERPRVAPRRDAEEWHMWAPVEAGGWPAVLSATDRIDIERRTGEVVLGVRRDDVNWATIYQWRYHRD